MHSHISMDSLEVYHSRIFLEFFPESVYSTLVAEKSQIYSVKITTNTFVSQKMESSFLLMPPSKTLPQVSLSFRQTGIAHFSQAKFFEDFFLLKRKGSGLWS